MAEKAPFRDAPDQTVTVEKPTGHVLERAKCCVTTTDPISLMQKARYGHFSARKSL